MDEITKRLTYALHDTFGYVEGQEKDADRIRKHLQLNGVSLIFHSDLDDMYQQGRQDERDYQSEMYD
jgi:hypothetical protein